MADADNSTANDNNGAEPKARRRGRPRRPVGESQPVGASLDGGANGAGNPEGGEAPGSPEPAPGAEPAPGPAADPGAFAPEAIAGEQAPPKKRRGRPPGSGTKAPGAKAQTGPDLTLKELATEIAGGYWMVAQITQQPVFDIGIERAAMIAKPLLDVQRYYPVKLDGPMISIAKLIGGIAAVNLPIIAYLGASRVQKKREAQAQRAAQPATPEEVIIPGATEAPRKYNFGGAA